MNRSFAPNFDNILQARLSRRAVLASGVSAAVAACTPPVQATARSIEPARTDAIELAAGLRHDVIIRWGDSLRKGVANLSSNDIASGALLQAGAGALAERRFGVNADGAHFFASTARGDRGILCVNNEYPSEVLMFPGWPGAASVALGGRTRFVRRNPEAAKVTMASVGVSVVEIERTSDGWRSLTDSPFNRRYHANTTMRISGPAAGSDWLRRPTDATGKLARGTMGNCAAGKTPWGTYLTAEENVQEYFGGFAALQSASTDSLAMRAHDRFPLWPVSGRSAWQEVDERFDASKHPQEALTFGWIVEIDPRGERLPVKRSALGRFMHESATCELSGDGRPVIYSGDDDHFEYLYKFIGSRKFDPKNPAANTDLLDDGVLHVARLNDDGTGEWLPLRFDEDGPLNSKAGFRNQADVIVMTRRAADLLGATPMDRPEDIAVEKKSGRAYVACTRNPYRQNSGERSVNASNPRANNQWGHIIELHEAQADLGATTFRWEVFILAGDPNSAYLTSLTDKTVASDTCYYGGYPTPSEVSGIGSPDNLAFDKSGNLWIVTDGPQPGSTNNGCFVAGTTGTSRGRVRQVLSAPTGAEVCGCAFGPDDRQLFLSIQHPGEGGSVESPVSHWPDGGDAQPRAAVIALEATNGRSIEV